MLGAFMSGLTSGAETMLNLRQKADELRNQLQYSEEARAAIKEKGEAQQRGGLYDPATTQDVSPMRDFAIPTDTTPTTGSGGGAGGAGGAGGIGDTSATGVGHSVPISERLAYYQKGAADRGLNYNAIAATVHGEGLHQFHGDKGQSFGDFQLYTGGGMGNEAENAGVNIRDPNHWQEAADYALDQMALHKGDPKWFAGQWHGAPGWAAQNFSNPNAPAPAGWSVPTYAGKQPSTIAGPQTQLAVGGGIAGGQGQLAPGYSPPAPTGPALAVGGGIAGGTGQPAPGYGPTATPTAAPAPAPAAPAAAPSPMAGGATPGAAPGSWLAVGDSLGTGYSRFAGMPGKYALDRSDPNYTGADAAAGRTPQEVMGFIGDAQKYDPDYFRGKNVMLSSGVSNDPSQIGVVPQQIKALKDAGANVQLVGVGNRAGVEAGTNYNLAPHNATLQQYAAQGGAAWGGPVPAVVHPPRSYYRMPKKAIS